MDYFAEPEANKLFSSLPKKYKKFVLEYLIDFNGSRAYRAACNPNDKFANNHACRLLANPTIKQILEHYYKQTHIAKEDLCSNLYKRINDPTKSGREQLAAIKLLAQMHGWLQEKEPDKIPTTINIIRGPIQGPTSV